MRPLDSKTFLLAVWVAVLVAACRTDPAEGEPIVLPNSEVEPAVWSIEPDIPTDADLFGVFGRTAEDVFAVGWGGTILHYDGAGWTLEPTTSTVPLTAVHGFIDP